MKKKCIIIYSQSHEPIYIAEVKELEPLQFIEKRNECDSNLRNLLTRYFREKDALIEKIVELEHQIKVLKGEEE